MTDRATTDNPAAARGRACTHWNSAKGERCDATHNIRDYIQGPACPAHTPAALAGQPEPPQGQCAPARCYCQKCPSWRPHNPYALNADPEGGRMTQLTYYPPPDTPHPDPDPAPDRHDGLRWGYTLNDLNHLTRMALARHIVGRNVIRAADRYHLAWSGVAEALYAADTPPDRADLIAAGHRALIEAREEELQAHGWSIDTGHLQTRPRFAAYWAPTGDGAGFADAIIDRLGLHAALQTLTPRQRDAVHAVATLGTYNAAQQHLGIGRGTLTSHLYAARLAILRAWMPGETPIPPRYVHNRAPIRCGTPHGYSTHSKRREKPCEACREAARKAAS